MRRMIAAMKVSLDGRMEGPEGYADWVSAWSDDYGITERVDACVLGGRMYSGYERYWTEIRERPNEASPMRGRLPTAGELAWSDFASRAPHFVVSRTLKSATWNHTSILASLGMVEELKRQPGKDIYLLGGQKLLAMLLERGQVDELHLIVYPLIAGPGKALFADIETRRSLSLLAAKSLGEGRVAISYAVG